MNNPWKVKRKETVYENPWIKVENHEVLNPAGNDGIYGTVHFKNIAIGVIPITDQLETFLVGQWRFPLNQYSWEIPEGGGKWGIDPLESAKRELREETGLVAQKWEETIRIHTSNSVADEIGMIYLARDLEQFEAQPDEDEVLEIKKLPIRDAIQMVLDGNITDSLSVAGLLKVNHLIQSNQL
tara:strand:- start:79 stop:627 length:549 start_codon:yes stop_codon:yes gene_type:complete